MVVDFEGGTGVRMEIGLPYKLRQVCEACDCTFFFSFTSVESIFILQVLPSLLRSFAQRIDTASFSLLH